ncbi:unnamed protein product [Strongylus vulgaris]|uniref:Uncharacterized protein n=1 Tax=Strongylus vulgaris TaxID=40348 RepID=A0A3P7KZE9_STRVU|nr:unnamed protein product [Strongylus vulgaris]
MICLRALPGEPLECFTRVFTVNEVQNGTDFSYELHFEASTKNSTTSRLIWLLQPDSTKPVLRHFCIAVIFRFLFFNRHVGVLYSCLSISHDGKCDERAIYVISRHETIDHAELIVLEKVAKAVCVDPHVLYHTATFGMCCFISEITKLVPFGENVSTALSFDNKKGFIPMTGDNNHYPLMQQLSN